MRLVLLLSVILPISIMAKDFSYGGYLKNSTALLFDSKIDSAPAYNEPAMFTDASELRLEGSFNWSNGGIEAHVILKKSFRPIIPFFETYRTNSLMMTIAEEYIQAYLSLVMPQVDSTFSQITGENTPILSEEQQKELTRLGVQLPYSTFYPTDIFNLDRALIKLYLPFADIYFGRQVISWGTGYAFNPTDLFNLKNPADAEAPKMGVNAIRAEIPLGDLGAVSLVASPGREFKHSSGGVRIKWNLAGFDMSVSGQSIMNSDRELAYLKRKVVAGADMAGEIGDIGVWSEVAVSNRIYTTYTDFDSMFTQVDIGADYTFSGGLYIMAEYLFSSIGEASWKDYDIYNLANISGGDATGMGRHYLFGGIKYDFASSFTATLFGLGNFQDESAMILPELAYLFNDNIELKFRGGIGAGNKDKSEFGSLKSSVGMTFTGFF